MSGNHRVRKPHSEAYLLLRVARELNGTMTRFPLRSSTWFGLESKLINCSIDITLDPPVVLSVSCGAVCDYLNSIKMRNVKVLLTIEEYGRGNMSLTLGGTWRQLGLIGRIKNEHSVYVYPIVSRHFVSHREFRQEFTSFLSPIQNSMSASSGCNRDCCPGVVVRVYNSGTYGIMMGLLSQFYVHLGACNAKRSHFLRLDGVSEPCGRCCLAHIYNRWCEANSGLKDTPTLHYYAALSTIVLSYCSGMLMVTTSVGMMDNVMLNGDVWSSGLLPPITRPVKVSAMFPTLDILPSTSLYITSLPAPRIMLMPIFLSQSICLRYDTVGNCRLVPRYNEWPLVTSLAMYEILGGDSNYGVGRCPYPGLNVRVTKPRKK